MGQGGALALQCRVRHLEATSARFWPSFRTRAPSVVDFGNADGFGVDVANSHSCSRGWSHAASVSGRVWTPSQVAGIWPAHSLTAVATDSRGGSARCRSLSLNGCSRTLSVRSPKCVTSHPSVRCPREYQSSVTLIPEFRRLTHLQRATAAVRWERLLVHHEPT